MRAGVYACSKFLAMIPATSAELLYKKDLAVAISVRLRTFRLTASARQKGYNVDLEQRS